MTLCLSTEYLLQCFIIHVYLCHLLNVFTLARKYFLMATKNWEMAPQNTLVAILQVDCIDLEQSSS